MVSLVTEGTALLALVGSVFFCLSCLSLLTCLASSLNNGESHFTNEGLCPSLPNFPGVISPQHRAEIAHGGVSLSDSGFRQSKLSFAVVGHIFLAHH